jgi:DOPA 4,5-dioxygenase
MSVQDIQMGSVVNPDIIQHYHAHVYYDPASSRDRAARLRQRVAATFPGATLGRWHDTPVGPHTQSMYQIAFPPPLLASFLPWLMLNRDGLCILQAASHALVGWSLAPPLTQWRW